MSDPIKFTRTFEVRGSNLAVIDDDGKVIQSLPAIDNPGLRQMAIASINKAQNEATAEHQKHIQSFKDQVAQLQQ